MAYALSLNAMMLDPGNDLAKWLAAAAWDRTLVRLGKPQRYGTQFRVGKDGLRVLELVDPTVTDEERAEWNVPPLEEARKRENRMNAGGTDRGRAP
jgi:hypothetical protein